MIITFTSNYDTANTLFESPVKGPQTPTYTFPVVTNLGYGGTISSGSPAFYTAGGGGTFYLNFVNSGGTITHRWQMSSASAVTTAIAQIGAALAGGAEAVTLASDGNATWTPPGS